MSNQSIHVHELTLLINFNRFIFRCVFFAYIIPEILTFLQSLKHMVFKTVHLPKLFDFFLVLLMESIHVTGMAILFYCALPHMDSVRAVMATRWIEYYIYGKIKIRNKWRHLFVIKLLTFYCLVRLRWFHQYSSCWQTWKTPATAKRWLSKWS